jgi:hypothetical protein
VAHRLAHPRGSGAHEGGLRPGHHAALLGCPCGGLHPRAHGR